MGIEELSELARIGEALESIAASLAVIAGDISDRNERETAANRAQLDYLQSVYDSAASRFEYSDKRMLRLGREASDRDGESNNLNERAAEAAWQALVAFKSAHPELAAGE